MVTMQGHQITEQGMSWWNGRRRGPTDDTGEQCKGKNMAGSSDSYGIVQLTGRAIIHKLLLSTTLARRPSSYAVRLNHIS